MLNRAPNIVLTMVMAVLPFGASAMDNPVHLTVLEGWRQPDGTHVAAIKLDLDEGWKTYWRAPGEAGIPPFFDFLGSENLVDFSVKWPAPVVFDQSGLWSVGYKSSVILPIEVSTHDASEDVQLSGVVDIGVCKDVCLPIALEIDATLEATKVRKSPAIRAAMASVPYTRSEANVQSAVCKLEADGTGMAIRTIVDMPTAGKSEFVVIESANPNHWFSEAETSRQGTKLTSESALVSLDGGILSIKRSDIRITVLGDDYAVDIQGCTGS